MPTIITELFKDKEVYFDLRPGGVGETEGFWAVPLYEGGRLIVERELAACGDGRDLWIELLVNSIRCWVGFREVDGTNFPCTAGNVRMLCESNPLFMRGLLVRIHEADCARMLLGSGE